MTKPSGNLGFTTAGADQDDDDDALEEEEEEMEVVDDEEGRDEEEHVVEVEEEEEEEEENEEVEEELEEEEGEEEDEVEEDELVEEDGNGEEEQIEKAELAEVAGEEKGEQGHELEAQEVEDEGVGDVVKEQIEEVLEGEEGKRKGEDGAGTDSASAAITLLDAKDACKMVKSREVDKDVKLVSCPMINDNAEKLHAQDLSLKVSKSNGINDASVAKVSSAVVAKDIQYVEDEYLPTVDEKCKGHHLEKENQKKASNLGKNDLKNHQSHLSLDCGDIKTVRDHKIDVTMEVGGMRDSKMVKYDVSEKVDSPQLGRTDSLDSSLRCGHTPLRRPRSPSPRASHDNMNKKPAMICQFYAKGWCIKGKLCKFLHQNDGNVTADQQAKEDKAGLSLTGDSLGSKGSENIVEEPRIISPSLAETNKAGSSECNTFLQRAFVPGYGTGSHESSYENATFHGTRQTRDVFFDKYRHHLDNYSSDSWQYQNSGKPLVYESTEDIDGTCGHRKFPNQETHSLLGFQGSLNSGLSSSYQLSDHNFSRAATSSNRGSTPSADCIEGHNSFDFDRGCHRSRSASLTRNFSPYRGLAHHNVLDDPPSWQKTKTEYDAWEPSQPFRPSFSLVTSNISSPQSQYDPILDSIEPESARGHSIPTSMPVTTNSMLHASGNAFSQTYEGALARNTSLHDSDVFGAVDIISESSKLKGERYMIDDEKVLKQDNPMERLNSKAAKAGGALRNPIDQSRRSKESKAYKAFNASLVDFVKELLKPWWREGCLSKDAHKSIVKKSAEKVLSALPSHQIPSSPEAINQYLTASRPKLTKLVEGYVEKYVNS